MAARIGKLLQTTLDKLSTVASETTFMASLAAGGKQNELPVTITTKRQKPKKKEHWKDYRKRVDALLKPLHQKLKQAGIKAQKLIAGNALAAHMPPEKIHLVKNETKFQVIELDPLVDVALMDEALVDIEHAAFRGSHPTLDGTGVRVAVLDSGVDTQHPHLTVTDSISTCGEPFSIPGRHGTHVAGSIASQHSVFAGVAPAVTLLNIKVLRADGTGQASFITTGIDAALDRNADILSMSVGFSHLPGFIGGHEWVCDDGDCVLCTAVDNAVLADNVLVVVATGNEHTKAENLRLFGLGNTFDTEVTCPGHAREAFSVGALTKANFLPAQFSSRGPTAYDTPKPSLAGPGVAIRSTVPVPRDTNGNPVTNPGTALLFGLSSGTSMATPIVSGAAALLIQERLDAGQTWTPDEIRNRLTTDGVTTMTLPANVVGAGRLDLAGL